MDLDDEASRKRARASGGGGRDRLSALPDCLLHVVMSFMKARQAVQTCVLSTRWRHLWRSVPCLDIDHREFMFNKMARASGGNAGSVIDISSDSDDDILDFKDEHKIWEDFEDFSVNLMRQLKIAQLDSFRLHIDRRAPEYSNRVAAGWLRRARKYCGSDCANHHVGLRSCSWRLRRLHLGHVLLDDRFMNHVISACPSLEDLELDGCTCGIPSITSHSLKTLALKNGTWSNLSKITSPTLKTLVIDGISNTNDCLLVILAPALAYLQLAVYVKQFCGGFRIDKASSLAKASICIKSNRFSTSKLCGDQFQILSSISNVNSLESSGVGTRVLGEKLRFLEFKNMRNLLLDNCDLSDNFHILAFFLQSSPILKKLTLRHCQFPKCPNANKGTPILNKISSSALRGLDLLCENLKVEIIYTHGYGPHLLQLLLRVSVNLSKNNIKLTKVS